MHRRRRRASQRRGGRRADARADLHGQPARLLDRPGQPGPAAAQRLPRASVGDRGTAAVRAQGGRRPPLRRRCAGAGRRRRDPAPGAGGRGRRDRAPPSTAACGSGRSATSSTRCRPTSRPSATWRPSPSRWSRRSSRCTADDRLPGRPAAAGGGPRGGRVGPAPRGPAEPRRRHGAGPRRQRLPRAGPPPGGHRGRSHGGPGVRRRRPRLAPGDRNAAGARGARGGPGRVRRLPVGPGPVHRLPGQPGRRHRPGRCLRARRVGRPRPRLADRRRPGCPGPRSQVSRHNDVDHVVQLLRARTQDRAVVLVESVYSVDGDAGPAGRAVRRRPGRGSRPRRRRGPRRRGHRSARARRLCRGRHRGSRARRRHGDAVQVAGRPGRSRAGRPGGP